MKKTLPIPLFAALVITCALVLVTTSCDTPKSIAWSYYYCAEDTLEAGDPYAAKHFLKACKKSVDSDLVFKVDSLMEVIDRAIEENKTES